MSLPTISITQNSQRKSTPWQLTYRVDGKRKRLSFRTRAEANSKRDLLKIEFENLGTKAFAISDSLRFAAVECSDLLKPHGYGLKDAVSHFLKYLESNDRSITIPALAEAFIQNREAKGLSSRHLADLTSRLARVSAAFPESLANQLQPQQIEDWVHSLAVSATTKNNYLKILKAVFNFALKRNFVDSNPLARIERLSTPAVEPTIVTPQELDTLLAISPPRLLPYVAIGAFAGLRTSELDKLDWAKIFLSERYIEVTGETSKTHRRLVAIPENLAEWLLPYAKTHGPIRPANCRKLLAAAWAAVFPNRSRKNDLRHSCASYHLAMHNKIDATTTQLGHSKAVLFRHYRKLVTEKQAIAYFAIKPTTAKNIVSIPSAKTA
ncbi:hypothetical protein N9B57_01200 [Verrucomicrobia bacterium]|nr:hypothetical protein [Verrucomicrobiota bacterium]